jgi:hypothetical protein
MKMRDGMEKSKPNNLIESFFFLEGGDEGVCDLKKLEKI